MVLLRQRGKEVRKFAGTGVGGGSFREGGKRPGRLGVARDEVTVGFLGGSELLAARRAVCAP